MMLFRYVAGVRFSILKALCNRDEALKISGNLEKGDCQIVIDIDHRFAV